jgi:hypothetical protein
MKVFMLTLCCCLNLIITHAADYVTLKNQMRFKGEILQLNQNNQSSNNALITNLTTQDDDAEACIKGEQDAKKYHGKRGIHFISGMMLGPIAFMITGLSSPTPDKGMFTYNFSKNKALFSDHAYISCYELAAKKQHFIMNGLGSLTSITLLAIMIGSLDI